MSRFRWTARFLLLAIIAPAFGPLAMAGAMQSGAPHCLRRTLPAQAAVPAAEPAMPCHHAMARQTLPESQSSQTSFRAVANCCQDHDCCCRVANSEWASPASALSFFNLLLASARTSQNAPLRSTDVAGEDSARAPPRN